jgi:hypothetical protein
MKKLCDMTEPELSNLMNDLASGIARKTDNCFILLIFDNPGVAQYVSNANRKDCIEAMKEAAIRLENREDVPR